MVFRLAQNFPRTVAAATEIRYQYLYLNVRVGRPHGVDAGDKMRRTAVAFSGQADHAGTIPMTMRRDAAGGMIAFLHDLQGRFKAMAADCARIECSVKIDYRKGRRGRLEAKVQSVEQKLGRPVKR